MQRRTFLTHSLAAACTAAFPLAASSQKPTRDTRLVDVAAIDRHRILTAADRYLQDSPQTLTTASSPRSTGGPHDYFSEGDYWWPNPKDPGGPYIRRDGLSNPDNFVGHRDLLIRLSLQVPALTAAWVLTKRQPYAAKAADHLRAWFVTPATRMNPSLNFAQAIHGVSPGRGTGIIDTLHLCEVARSAAFLEHAGVLSPTDTAAIRAWFTDYITWMTTSKNGLEERDAKNNHGTTWVTQLACFASYVADTKNLDFARHLFRTKLIPDQVAADGSLPLELARTKPYSYSLFDMDALATIAHIASTPADNLWTFTTPAGRSIAQVIAFYAPFIQDKSRWPFPHDVEYWDDLPVRQPSLLFAGLAYRNPAYVHLWTTLNPDPTVPEVIRNYPIRQPILWVTQPS